MTGYLPRLISPLLLLTALPLVGGCGAETPDADPAGTSALMVRDSAGIRVVENDLSPAWEPDAGWRLADTPSVRIGDFEGPPHVAFGYALAPSRLSDGRIVVADRQVNHIHFYDSAGAHLQTVGRSGRGPGEFSQIWRMYRIQGDSLMVLNPTTLTSIFSPEGEFTRRYELDPVPGRPNIWWKGRFPDGSMLGFSLSEEGTEYVQDSGAEGGRRIVRPDRGPFYRDSLLHFLYTPEGELIDSLMKIPGQWLGENRTFAPSEAYRVDGEYFYTSPGNVVAIHRWRWLSEPVEPSSTAPAGLIQLEQIVRRPPLNDTRITDAMVDEVHEGIRDRYRMLADRGIPMAGAAREIEMLQLPESLPAHGNALRIDPDGNLWLLEYRRDTSAPQEWSVFGSDGRWLGVVETPPTFTVNEIGRDYILGVNRDEFDVQYVEMYDLIRPAG